MKQLQQKINSIETLEKPTKNPTTEVMKSFSAVANLDKGLQEARINSQIASREKLERDFALDPFKTVDTLLKERVTNLSNERMQEFLDQANVILDQTNFEDCMISNESRVLEVFGESFMPILRSIDVYTEEHLRDTINNMLESQHAFEKASSFEQVNSKLEAVGIDLECKLKGVEIYFSNNPKATEKLIKFFDYLCYIKTNLNKNITSLKNDLRNVEFNDQVPDNFKFPLEKLKEFFGGGIYPEFNNCLEVDISPTHRLMLNFSENKIEIKGLGVMGWH